MAQVTKDMTIGEIVTDHSWKLHRFLWKSECIVWVVLLRRQRHLQEAAMVHGIDADLLEEKINAFLNA